MKRLLILIVSILTLAGCTKPHWVQTSNGKYIYGKIKDKYNLVWDGPCKAVLADGNGTLSSFDDEGQLKESVQVTTKLGVVSDYSYVTTEVGSYLGKKKKNLPNGFGVLIKGNVVKIGYFKKGYLNKGNYQEYSIVDGQLMPVRFGFMKKGKISGVGEEYANGELVYKGGFKKGLRNGIGQAYENGELIYNGSWKNGKRHGNGTQYKAGGLIAYEGEWGNDQYDGRGKLYENGICQEGRWEEGRLTKSISTSAFSDLAKATKRWFSSDTLAVEEEIVQKDLPVATSQMEFISSLDSELREHLQANFDKKVEKRFGFWNLLRMFFQPWFKSDVKRAGSAQKYFCKEVSAQDIQNFINEKVDYYNRTASDKLSYVKLDKFPNDAIVDTDVALKVFEREALETTDIGVGILVDIIICLVIAFIIGFFIGRFIPSLAPYAGIVDIIMGIIAFGIGLYLSVIRTTALSLELEASIKQMLVDNYMLFIDSQNVITQLLGL